jgi:hypothetical protein
MTVPMLARIDDAQQATKSEVEEKLRHSAANLSRKISLGQTDNKS